MAEPKAKPESFGRTGPPQRESHHQHVIHELGSEEMGVAKDLLTVFKKQVTSLARIEALLSDMDDKLDEITVGAADKAELEAFRSVAYPAMIASSEKLNAFTPEA